MYLPVLVYNVPFLNVVVDGDTSGVPTGPERSGERWFSVKRFDTCPPGHQDWTRHGDPDRHEKWVWDLYLQSRGGRETR